MNLLNRERQMFGRDSRMRKPLHSSGSRPCPHCHRTISANKEMCWAGVTEFGTVEAFLAAKQAELLKAAA